MLKFLILHATPPVCIWLALSPAVHAAEEKTAAESARPALAAPFNQYKNFRDEPVRDWRQANDRVNVVGGWRTYLRESYQDGSTADPSPHAR